MAAIRRRVLGYKIPASTTLAAADDLDGGTTTLEVGGSARVLIVQHNNGTAGTTGIDTIEVSKDGGKTWAADDTILALASDDNSGTVLSAGVLNAAGVEPVNMAVFKSGPHTGPTLMRCSRLVTQDADSAAWTTGAPSVIAILVGSA